MLIIIKIDRRVSSTFTFLQTVTRGYKDSVNWVETSKPWVMEQVGPYLSTVQHWAMEAGEKVGEAKVAAIEKLEEARPGSKKQIENFGVEFAKFSEDAISRIQDFLHTAQDTTVQIIK